MYHSSSSWPVPVPFPFPNHASIGHPIAFTSGQFTGSTIRMQLNELQKANLGRKYARVDRRPLDPPPVVQLTIFQVQHPGTDMELETELDYEAVQIFGLICTVDLFPVPDYFVPSQAHHRTSSKRDLGVPPLSQTYPIQNHLSTATQEIYASEPMSAEWQNQCFAVPDDIFLSSGSTPTCSENYPVVEATKQTQSLAGSTFVQAIKLDYQDKMALLFVFPDLAVKNEGAFILRYRVFDLFSHPPSQNGDDAVVAAEAYGGPFRVYSTKDFPGLGPSTDLTKHLARWGVRLNIRETERKRKKRSLDTPPDSSIDFAFSNSHRF